MKTLNLNVRMNFSDNLSQEDVNGVMENVMFGIERQRDNSGLVIDNCENYTSCIKITQAIDMVEWAENHFEIVTAIKQQLDRMELDGVDTAKAWKVENEQGRGGLYELSAKLTNKFMAKYANVIWGEEIEYVDTMEQFIKDELYN